jgi:hypothetical protein
MNIPVYGVSNRKVWTARELLGDDVAPKNSENALRDALKHASKTRKGGNE